MGDLPAMKTEPKFIFFTDFDGTITLQDSNDWLTDNLGFGQQKRRQCNMDTLDGTYTFRETFKDMMESVTIPFNECKTLLIKNVSLDPHFKSFFLWTLSQNIPVVVVSSGMEPIIRALLDHLIGPEAQNIQIVANTVKTKEGKTWNDEDGWEIVFHDDSDFGHDKSLELRPYAALPADKRPTMFYAGDGVSDLSAAEETDLLFAKKGMDLVSYCVSKDIPFTTFEDWSSIHAKVKQIVAGEQNVEDAAKEGLERYQKDEADEKEKKTVK